MATEVQIALQPQAGRDLAAQQIAAAVRQVRASLALLAQQVGQSFVGTVVDAPELPSGFSQISTDFSELWLRVERPIAAGSRVQLQVQPGPGPNAAPAIQVTPLPQTSSQTDAGKPAQATASPARLSGAVPAAKVVTMTTQPAMPSPERPTAPVATIATAATVESKTSQQWERPGPAPAPTPTPTMMAAPKPSAPVVGPASPHAAKVIIPSAPPMGAEAVAPSKVPTFQAIPPVPPQSAPVAPLPPATLPPSLQANGVPGLAPTPLVKSPPTPILPTAPKPEVSGSTGTVNKAAGSPTHVQLPAPPSAPPRSASPALSPSIDRAPEPGSVAAPPLPATPRPHAAQALPQALSPPASIAGQPAGAASQPMPLVALQQSPTPLFEALSRQMAQLPPAVAQAAAQVLAQRLPLDRTPPTATALKSAVMQSGVLIGAPAGEGASPDLKTALTQLRTALLDWAGAAVDPVAPVARRSPPPMRGAPPRVPLAPLPAPEDEAAPEDFPRQLLSKTEGALARLKLFQLTSQGNDQRLGATTTPAEWNLELPLLVGRELAMVQVQIGREGRDQKQAQRSAWRLRFAMRLQAIGEVGAHVVLSGNRTSVALWAEEPETAELLETMLPELAGNLAAKGLEIGALSMRRAAPPQPTAAPGHLMDSTR